MVGQMGARKNQRVFKRIRPRWTQINGTRSHDNIAGYLSRQISTRFAKGKEAYGEEFQGNPYYHLKEELIDAMFYGEIINNQLAEAVELLHLVMATQVTTPSIHKRIEDFVLDYQERIRPSEAAGRAVKWTAPEAVKRSK